MDVEVQLADSMSAIWAGVTVGTARIHYQCVRSDRGQSRTAPIHDRHMLLERLQAHRDGRIG
jgi:hypothetical protein